jgi:hypothetical protein
MLGVGVIAVVTFGFWSIVLILAPRSRYVGLFVAFGCVLLARQVVIMWRGRRR